MEILLLTLLFQIKHCFADFVLQTYKQTVKKGVWLDPVGISHTIEHVYCSLSVLVMFSIFVPVSIPLILFAVVVEGLVHYLVDYSKVQYGNKDNTTPAFWTQFGIDQLVHQITYIWIVWLLLV